MKRFAKKFIKLCVIVGLLGCSQALFHQPGGRVEKVFSRTFITDYNTAWISVSEALRRFSLTDQNRESGIIQSDWIDNTAEKNFSDAGEGDPLYQKARYRLSLNVAPVKRGQENLVKVSIYKRQMVQRDVLEGWREVSSDTVEENSVLYRIGRIIQVKNKLKEIEDEKVRKTLEEGV